MLFGMRFASAWLYQGAAFDELGSVDGLFLGGWVSGEEVVDPFGYGLLAFSQSLQKRVTGGWVVEGFAIFQADDGDISGNFDPFHCKVWNAAGTR